MKQIITGIIIFNSNCHMWSTNKTDYSAENDSQMCITNCFICDTFIVVSKSI